MTEHEGEGTNGEAGGARNTRAPERAKGDAVRLVVTHVEVPPDSADRRSPVATVGVWVGPVHLLFTVSSLAGNKLTLRPPVAAGSGDPGATMARDLAERVAAAVMAAAKADPIARHVLNRRPVPEGASA